VAAKHMMLQQIGGKTRCTATWWRQNAGYSKQAENASYTATWRFFFYFNLFNHILENESCQILFLNLSLLRKWTVTWFNYDESLTW
jgi:hypothetical protein